MSKSKQEKEKVTSERETEKERKSNTRMSPGIRKKKITSGRPA
jgi:hypothetical protein